MQIVLCNIAACHEGSQDILDTSWMWKPEAAGLEHEAVDISFVLQARLLLQQRHTLPLSAHGLKLVD